MWSSVQEACRNVVCETQACIFREKLLCNFTAFHYVRHDLVQAFPYSVFECCIILTLESIYVTVIDSN